MSIIDRMKAHFAGLGAQKIEVPEWGEDGRPLVIYYHPITLAERQKIMAAGERDGAVAAYADVLIMKALDAQGKNLYTIEHKHALRHSVDPDIIRRVGMQMMVVPTAAEMGNASSRTPDSD